MLYCKILLEFHFAVDTITMYTMQAGSQSGNNLYAIVLDLTIFNFPFFFLIIYTIYLIDRSYLWKILAIHVAFLVWDYSYF